MSDDQTQCTKLKFNYVNKYFINFIGYYNQQQIGHNYEGDFSGHSASMMGYNMQQTPTSAQTAQMQQYYAATYSQQLYREIAECDQNIALCLQAQQQPHAPQFRAELSFRLEQLRSKKSHLCTKLRELQIQQVQAQAQAQAQAQQQQQQPQPQPQTGMAYQNPITQPQAQHYREQSVPIQPNPSNQIPHETTSFIPPTTFSSHMPPQQPLSNIQQSQHPHQHQNQYPPPQNQNIIQSQIPYDMFANKFPTSMYGQVTGQQHQQQQQQQLQKQLEPLQPPPQHLDIVEGNLMSPSLPASSVAVMQTTANKVQVVIYT